MPVTVAAQARGGENAMSRWVGMVAVCLVAGTSTTFAQSPSAPRYAVAGLALGSRVQFNSSDYREYKCSPSEQFAEFTWCQKTRQERDRRQSFNVTYSILHSQDGTVLYVNRFQEPAFFGPNEANEAIRRNSIRLGAQARIERLPRRVGLQEGVLATWGKVTLEPLDNESIKTLAEGRSPKKGYLIDFVGNFSRSAKEGLPIYRITGGSGLLWVASYDQIGRGTLRYAAIDPSGIHPAPLPSEARSSDPQLTPTTAERANPDAAVDRQDADIALQDAKKTAEKAKADAQVARNEVEAANRDAQLAKAEAERLSAESTKFNAALEKLETEKAAAETKAHTMESVAYGTIAILIAFLVSPLIVNRRKASAAKHQGIRPERSQVTEHPAVTEQALDSQPSKASGTVSSSTELAPSSPSVATSTGTQDESGISESKSPKSDTAEERVILPM
jgi:hypothetical protein